MNVILNRLKLVDSILGESAYDRSQVFSLEKYFNIKNAEKAMENVLVDEDGPINSFKLLFLSMQDKKYINLLKDKIALKEDKYQAYISNVDKCAYVVFESELEIEIMDLALDTLYTKESAFFVQLLRDGVPEKYIKKIIEIIKSESCNPFTHRWNGPYLPCESIGNIVKNENLINMEKERLITVIKHYTENFEGFFNNLSKEDVSVLLSPDCAYLYKIDKEQLELVNKTRNILDDNLMCKFSEAGNTVFRFKKEMSDFIETIESQFTDKETKSSILCALLEAMSFGFILEGSDVNLLINKIKYGSVYSDGMDIGFEISNIEKEKFNSLDLLDSYMSTLIEIKKNFTKGFYKKIINSEELLKKLGRFRTEIFISISSVLELGQLNEGEIVNLIEDVATNPRRSILFANKFKDIGYKLSYAEFVYCKDYTEYLEEENLISLKDLKQSARLLKIKEFVSINEILLNETFIVNTDKIKKFVKDKDIKIQKMCFNCL